MADRIAVITDVHGNAPALRAALAEIDATSDVERIYCLGDCVSIGPDTNEVLDMLFGRSDITMLLGNHEDYVLALYTGRTPKLEAEEREHQEWIAARLDPTHAAKLAALPRECEAEYAGLRLWFRHYHADPVHTYAPIDRQPSVEGLEARYAGAAAHAICFGHHHPVHLFRSERQVYVNPGSLGCCDRPLARYAILTVDQAGVEVELMAAPYDNRDFLASYDRLGVPAREFILRIFHGNQSR